LGNRLIRVAYALSLQDNNSNANCNKVQQQSKMVELLTARERNHSWHGYHRCFYQMRDGAQLGEVVPLRSRHSFYTWCNRCNRLDMRGYCRMS